RYFCLTAHYRKPLMFSWEAMESAKNSRKKLVEKVLEIKAVHGQDNKKLQQRYLDSFKAAVNDDLNTPQALAVMWDVLKDDELGNHDKYLLLLEFDRVFGLELGNVQEEKVPAAVKKLAEERLLARKKKEWKKSDLLRDEISTLGWIVEDDEKGYGLRRK
ncbi:MAG TPA: DALR domain-containing protein, partial [Candidatus Nanoarchaeia archaeon]|nr:DALR domain-containing protein [Candidatus Nanoarchaeia archaeon]